MNIKITSIVFLVIISLFMGCRKDYEKTNKDEGPSNPPEVFVNCSITGIVKDPSGQPLNFVTIVHDSTIIQTDDNGFFYLKDIQANSNGAIVTASLNGYIKNTTKVYPKLNNISLIQITLTQGMVINGTNGLAGGTVNFLNGSELIIKANSTINLSGDLYKGEINIMSHQLDPMNGLFSENILSTQFGLDLLQNITLLQSYGAFNIQTFDNSQQLVSFASDNPAIFKAKISDKMLSYAPERILLWKYDNDIHKWKRSGSASKINGFYHASIEESGWYNLATSHVPAQIQSTFVDDQLKPIAYSTVSVNGETNNFQLNFITDNNGSLKAFLPVNDKYSLTLKNCNNEVIQTHTTDNISSNENLGNINFSGNQELVQIEAQLLNCDNQVVKMGYVKLNSAPITIIPVEKNGLINSTLFVCHNSDEIVYSGFDWENKNKGDRLNRVFDPHMEMGNVFACPTTDSTYINIFQDSINIVRANSATISIETLSQQTVFVITGIFEKPNNRFVFKLFLNEDYNEGSQTAVDLNYLNPQDNINLGIEFDNIVNDSINVDVIRKAYKVGELIKGSFNCQYIDENMMIQSLSGDFRAIFK